jgi:putative glutathione S-transferase
MLAKSSSLFILGNQQPKEVDIKLYTTPVRFETMYQQHFVLMLRSIRHAYPRLNRWLKNMHWNLPGMNETTNFKHTKEN